MEYAFNEIEQKWQTKWKTDGAYKVPDDSNKPKYYVLDMFPYPSGAGLHVGHPLGYIASDIFARYKRLKGFNVLHPMGYDAFGLPAEQYALDHGVHPADSTKQNIANFRNQLDKIGFSFDWSREVNTSKPEFYRWTQWIFLQLFNSWYDRKAAKATPVQALIAVFGKEGSAGAAGYRDKTVFTAAEWKSFNEKQQQDILMDYRLAYCGVGEVNWCAALGTVLANDEVVNGVSERGGHPVVKTKLRQWYLRITEYADRLLEGLGTVEYSDAMKEMQSNWIGRSTGAEIDFAIVPENVDYIPAGGALPDAAGAGDRRSLQSGSLRVYTTRPDTIFGVDFMVVAPEHELIPVLTSPGQKKTVEEYVAYVKSRSERERMAEKKITGCFTGGYVANPFNGSKIPVWISEYVLAGYGTGAIMAVPCGDERDFKFANYFGIPVTNIIGAAFDGKEANPTKEAILENSDFLNGMVMRDAISVVTRKLETMGIGNARVNYRMRDAAFSRQRYWGEPFPIVWKGGIAYPLPESELPLLLPEVKSYKPGPDGEGPLANISEWTSRQLETNTMPGYAGSSWYFLRYMDPHNKTAFCDRKNSDYWNQVDLYVGGTEHAVGHLLYSRLWTKCLYDLGYIGFEEPYRRLLNQGMIQGSSRFVYRISSSLFTRIGADETVDSPQIFVSKGLLEKLAAEKPPEGAGQPGSVAAGIASAVQAILTTDKSPFQFNSSSPIGTDALHVDVNLVDGAELDPAAFRNKREEYATAAFIFEEGTWSATGSATGASGTYICGIETEKMSKSKFNTVNPDDLVQRFGADTFRMYEMFLGPVEQSKPWDTKGIEGVHRFLRKLWRLFFSETGKIWTTGKPTPAELKVLHKTIKKIGEDTERFSFNTGVSALMIAVNELGDLKCNKKEILEQILVLLAPYAPHIAEELWQQVGNAGSILDATYPTADESLLVESAKRYPIAINGKPRSEMDISLDATQAQVEEMVMADEVVKKWLEGKAPKKIIYVKNKMINVVI